MFSSRARSFVGLLLFLCAPGATDVAAQTRPPVLAPDTTGLLVRNGPARPGLTVGRQEGDRSLEYAFTGLVAGALAGAGLYWVLENTDDHTDHSEDGFALRVLTLSGAAVGTAIGAVVGILRADWTPRHGPVGRPGRGALPYLSFGAAPLD